MVDHVHDLSKSTNKQCLINLNSYTIEIYSLITLHYLQCPCKASNIGRSSLNWKIQFDQNRSNILSTINRSNLFFLFFSTKIFPIFFSSSPKNKCEVILVINCSPSFLYFVLFSYSSCLILVESVTKRY